MPAPRRSKPVPAQPHLRVRPRPGAGQRSPKTGAAFNFWHPDLVTLHVWLWNPNPSGLYNGTNPYIQPFTDGAQTTPNTRHQGWDPGRHELGLPQPW